jgi:hypothetical protein
MASSRLRLRSPPSHACYAEDDNLIAVLHQPNVVELWQTAFTCASSSRVKVEDPILLGLVTGPSVAGEVKQVALTGSLTKTADDANGLVVAVLSTVGSSAGDGSFDTLTLIRVWCGEDKKIENEVLGVIEVNDPSNAGGRLVACGNTILVEMLDGVILYCDVRDNEGYGELRPLLSLPEFCPIVKAARLSNSSDPLVVGQSESGRLYCGSRTLATNSSSFTIGSDFLIFTTFAHEAHFIPLESLALSETPAFYTEPMATSSTREAISEGPTEAAKRRVERGSSIVTVVPSSMSLVLQMPRGNLETVCPRPLVLRVVRQHLDEAHYRSAFIACRKHRIDLNLLHDHNPEAFMQNLSTFVGEVREVDYLNFFLSSLRCAIYPSMGLFYLTMLTMFLLIIILLP